MKRLTSLQKDHLNANEIMRHRYYIKLINQTLDACPRDTKYMLMKTLKAVLKREYKVNETIQ